MPQSGNCLHSVGTMWSYVCTPWQINTTERKVSTLCGIYVELCEHTVIDCFHYMVTMWTQCVCHCHTVRELNTECKHFQYVTTMCHYYMIHTVSITTQWKGCFHTVVTLCSHCVHTVDYMNTLCWLCVLSGRANYPYSIYTAKTRVLKFWHQRGVKIF